MAGPRNKALDWLAYLALRGLAAVVRVLPVRAAYGLAWGLGELMWLADRKHRRVACGHLRLSFPDWPEEKVRQAGRRSMHGLFYLGIEILLTDKLITPKRWARHIVPYNLGEGLRLVLRGDSGFLLLTGHFGNFEVVGYTLATLGFPMVSIARPVDNPFIWDYMVSMMERTGQRFLYKKGAMGSAEAVLGQGALLGVVADQDAGRKGLFVDFFGRPASTYRSIAVLAMRHEVPVIIGFGRRLNNRFSFEIGVQRIIHPREWSGRDDPARWITQEFTRELENVVRRAPEQYLWVHRRWKTRPDGAKAGGDGVA